MSAMRSPSTPSPPRRSARLFSRDPLARDSALVDVLMACGFESPASEIQSKIAEFGIDGVRPYSVRRNLAALAVVAEFTHVVLSYVTLVLFTKKETEDRFRASITVLSLIHTDVRSIILLCSRGYDVQARNILRSLRERIDVLGCCALSNRFSCAFIEASTPELINKFWHSHIRGKKARAFYAQSFSAWTSDTEDILNKFWSGWRADAESVLNATEHVFHGAGFAALFPGDGTQKDELGVDGLPGKYSLWTIRTSIFFLWELLMLCRVAFVDLRDGTYETEGEPNETLLRWINEAYPKYSDLLRLLAHKHMSVLIDLA
jgi:hypothetical protein